MYIQGTFIQLGRRKTANTHKDMSSFHTVNNAMNRVEEILLEVDKGIILNTDSLNM